MAVNNFPSTAGGGQPNMDYVKSMKMATAAQSWNRAGSAGTYAIFSSSASSGYAYFVGSSTTGVPLNKVITITHSFTRIDIVGIPNDILNLYKVALDSNTSTYSTPEQAYYQWFDNSLVTAKIETFAAGGVYTLPVFAMPVADIQVIAGGGAGKTHGAGGGGGGLVTTTLFPVLPNTVFTVGAGSTAPDGFGGNSTFGTLTAIGGASARNDYYAANGGSGSGAAKSGANQAKSGGSSTQTVNTGGRTISSLGSSGGGCDNSTQHAGGGGGGAGGVGGLGSSSAGGAGGAGVLSIITGQFYSTGGAGSGHESKSWGGSPNGYGNPGSGGRSNPESGYDNGKDGMIIVRSYG